MARALVLALWLAGTIAGACTLVQVASARAAGALSFQPVIGLPASDVSLIGASPGEAPGETWAQGQLGQIPALVDGQTVANAQVLLRYTSASGAWQVVPVENAHGESLSFKWSGSEVTQAGGVVLAGSGESGLGLLVRDPGGAFAPMPSPSSGTDPPLAEGEQLLTSSSAPVMAALGEGNGHTGVLIAPIAAEAAPASTTKAATSKEAETTSGTGGSTEAETPGPGILHYDGSSWTREPICEKYEAETCLAPAGTLTALALAASSPQSSWLLAGTSAEPTMLFQRVLEPSGKEAWVRRRPASWLLHSGEPPPSGERASPASGGPLLTATGHGVWVDLQLNTSSSSGNGTVLVEPGASGEVAGTWCYPTSLCPGAGSLGAPLPRTYDSFAWPGSSGAGTRIVTGLSEGALLRLGEGQDEFSYIAGGGSGGADAAFASPEEGWLGTGANPPTIHVTSGSSAGALSAWSVPFRRPLLALAAEPGSTPGEGSAGALAVGVSGEIARYDPGEGWTPEYLYNSSGERQTPNLRGVAWPEPGRAYAVGDEGAMWLWQASTGLWTPDPAEPPGFDGQLTAIAFSSVSPSVGYAVGKQGVLLSYDKTWIQDPLPPSLSKANFTSVAFAGEEAIATYRMLDPTEAGREIGGLIVNDGSGWHLDPSAQALLGETGPVLSKVAGLADGGAVAAGPGIVIERDSATSPWRYSSQPLPEAQNVTALAAIREGATVRALVSLSTSANDNPNGSLIYEAIDNPAGAPLSPYEALLGPDPLPEHGFLLRETASGWQDEQHGDYPTSNGGDLPGWPDSVLALLSEPSGEGGWAVGGETGALYGSTTVHTEVQTAGVERYGSGPAPPQSTNAPIATPSGTATFAVGGDAECLTGGCANLANEDIGPDAWLSGAIEHAGEIDGLHAFLYTGGRIAEAGDADSSELERYAYLLHSGGSLPVYAAASPTDIVSPDATAAFTEALGSTAPAGSAPSRSPKPPEGTAAYAFDSPGSGGTVRVIVLDDTQSVLAPPGEEEPCHAIEEGQQPTNQLQWLCAQLRSAREEGQAAIAMGNANVASAAEVQVLTSQGASAYLFDSAGEDVKETLGSGADAIPGYGSGTLGYAGNPSGFLLVSVDVAQRDASTGVAPVTAKLIPNIGQLGLNAADGTLLRRSQVALFEGLGRRPIGGEGRTGTGVTTSESPDPYTLIPQPCAAASCIQMQASFTSSNPAVGDFVEQSPSSTNPRALLQVNGKPVADSDSGLFCAYNAGTTTVTISAGGISYSESVTVEAGSVEEPCGTVPIASVPTAEETQIAPVVAPPPPPLAPSPPATQPFLSLTPPPLPPTVASTVAPPVHPSPPIPPALFRALPPPAPVRVAVPPPVPQAARPAPPSGTSEVSQTVGAAEKEREEEGAVDVVHNAAAYEPGGNTLPPWSPIALIVVAAAAGSSLKRRRSGRRPAFARGVSNAHSRRR